jgi:hypothetical protein
MIALLKTFGRLGSIVALILLVVTLLRQLVTMFGFLLAFVKFAIVMAFVVIIVMVALAILRDRTRRRKEAEDF